MHNVTGQDNGHCVACKVRRILKPRYWIAFNNYFTDTLGKSPERRQLFQRSDISKQP